MASGLNVLSFEPRVVSVTRWQPRFLRRSLVLQRDEVFLDFVVDGRPLPELLEVPEDVQRPSDDVVSDLGDSSPAEAVLQVERLLGLAPNQDGGARVWLLFCAACHDEGCGGLTVKVERDAGVVVWSEFAWESLPDEPPMILSASQRFAFGEADYDGTLKTLRAHFQALRLPPGDA
jgi:hypothetical protein